MRQKDCQNNQIRIGIRIICEVCHFMYRQGMIALLILLIMEKPLTLIGIQSMAVAILFASQACSPVESKEQPGATTDFVCMPCGRDCDKQFYSQQGECPHCNMQMVEKSTVVFDNIAPADICDYIAANPGVILLDVRTSDEFNGKAKPDFGRLKNAVNIPIQELNKRMSELDGHKGKQIIVYCSHSRRSPQASWMLTQNGFGKIANMAGGMSEWEGVNNKDCRVYR